MYSPMQASWDEVNNFLDALIVNNVELTDWDEEPLNELNNKITNLMNLYLQSMSPGKLTITAILHTCVELLNSFKDGDDKLEDELNKLRRLITDQAEPESDLKKTQDTDQAEAESHLKKTQDLAKKIISLTKPSYNDANEFKKPFNNASLIKAIKDRALTNDSNDLKDAGKQRPIENSTQKKNTSLGYRLSQDETAAKAKEALESKLRAFIINTSMLNSNQTEAKVIKKNIIDSHQLIDKIERFASYHNNISNPNTRRIIDDGIKTLKLFIKKIDQKKLNPKDIKAMRDAMQILQGYQDYKLFAGKNVRKINNSKDSLEFLLCHAAFVMYGSLETLHGDFLHLESANMEKNKKPSTMLGKAKETVRGMLGYNVKNKQNTPPAIKPRESLQSNSTASTSYKSDTANRLSNTDSPKVVGMQKEKSSRKPLTADEEAMWVKGDEYFKKTFSGNKDLFVEQINAYTEYFATINERQLNGEKVNAAFKAALEFVVEKSDKDTLANRTAQQMLSAINISNKGLDPSAFVGSIVEAIQNADEIPGISARDAAVFSLFKTTFPTFLENIKSGLTTNSRAASKLATRNTSAQTANTKKAKTRIGGFFQNRIKALSALSKLTKKGKQIAEQPETNNKNKIVANETSNKPRAMATDGNQPELNKAKRAAKATERERQLQARINAREEIKEQRKKETNQQNARNANLVHTPPLFRQKFAIPKTGVIPKINEKYEDYKAALPTTREIREGLGDMKEYLTDRAHDVGNNVAKNRDYAIEKARNAAAEVKKEAFQLKTYAYKGGIRFKASALEAAKLGNVTMLAIGGALVAPAKWAYDKSPSGADLKKLIKYANDIKNSWIPDWNSFMLKGEFGIINPNNGSITYLSGINEDELFGNLKLITLTPVVGQRERTFIMEFNIDLPEIGIKASFDLAARLIKSGKLQDVTIYDNLNVTKYDNLGNEEKINNANLFVQSFIDNFSDGDHIKCKGLFKFSDDMKPYILQALYDYYDPNSSKAEKLVLKTNVLDYFGLKMAINNANPNQPMQLSLKNTKCFKQNDLDTFNSPSPPPKPPKPSSRPFNNSIEV